VRLITAVSSDNSFSSITEKLVTLTYCTQTPMKPKAKSQESQHPPVDHELTVTNNKPPTNRVQPLCVQNDRGLVTVNNGLPPNPNPLGAGQCGFPDLETIHAVE
jgi:hypothetical protein